MGKRLQTIEDHVTDIRISTATVDIQVMRIGTKQMTLAVFRQLPFSEIFCRDGNLLAPPWGWVNYDRDYGKPFVFSHEGILYRARVNLEMEHQLAVRPETQLQEEPGHYKDEPEKPTWQREWIPTRNVRVPTGAWCVQSSQEYCDFRKVFALKDDARRYYETRRASVATLEAAPQLFIGV